jgi:hypothetical protein
VDGRITEKALTKIGLDVIHWIHLAPGTDHWRALVNMVMNFMAPYKAVNFLTS